MGKMAIVKASFTRSSGAAKANIRYIQHRKGRDGQKITRELFGADGAMQRLQAYELIDGAAKGTLFYRLIINPDPQREDTEKDLPLQEITQQTMLHLAERKGLDVPYIAATHAEHTSLRHVHILAAIKGKLTVADLQFLRLSATEQALEQRKERDQAREQQQQEGQGRGQGK